MIPWYRERWPWILISLPAAAVIAGVITFVLAIRNDDGVVADDYYKQGLAINQVLKRGVRAHELGIAAELTRGEAAQLLIHLRGTAPLPPALKLRLVHPTRSGEDRQIMLVARGEGRYAGELGATVVGVRRLVLEDSADQWRIEGVWDSRDRAVRLRAP